MDLPIAKIVAAQDLNGRVARNSTDSGAATVIQPCPRSCLVDRTLCEGGPAQRLKPTAQYRLLALVVPDRPSQRTTKAFTLHE
jgi:hypothetical protein